MTKRIILDTDPGIDDSLAILLALASPEITLEGLSVVHGNSSTAQGTINALSVLELAKASHIPVYKGCELPLVQPSLLAPETHGEQGIGYAKLSAPQTKPQGQKGSDFLIEKIMTSPGEITLVCIGPLTNIAMAIRQEPRIVENVKEVFIMGGAMRHEGNTTPLAEFNTFVDPHAAHIVFHSGMPITLTPLDVTYECIFLKDDLNRLLKIDSPITKFITDATRFYMEFHDEYQKIDGCVINDPLTLALTFMPDLCDYQDLYVDVDLSGGISMGNTFADFYKMTQKPSNIKVALGVKPRDFMEVFFGKDRKTGKINFVTFEVGKCYYIKVIHQSFLLEDNMFEKIKKDFTTMTWVLIPVAIAINIAIGQIVVLLKLPVFLDSIGTVLVAILCGPWAGALTGALSNTIWGLFNPDSLPWWPVAFAIGLVAGLCANAGLFKSWWKVILSGFLIALTAAIVSTPISVYLYGGISASGSSFITAYLMQTGQGVVSAVLSTGFLVEPVDKITTAMLAFAIVQGLSKRLVARFPRPENAEVEDGNNTTQLIIALVVVVVVVALGFVVRNMLAG